VAAAAGLTAQRIAVGGTWWRLTPVRSDPLFWTAEPADGRWQRGDVVRALYLADSPATAWAEWYRHSAELGVPPQLRLPRDLWRFELDVDGIADLTDPDLLVRLGLPKLLPTRRQWPLTQSIGEAVFAAGYRGLLAPSAAHESGRVLASFRTQPGPIAGVKPRRPPTSYAELPPLPTGLRT
jgi:RES domain-containing protein